MDGLTTFTAIVMIAFGILQIILFFKIWGMTDDVREIKEKYLNGKLGLKAQKSLNQNKDYSTSSNFQVGDLVINIANDKQMRIMKIEDGCFWCTTNGGLNNEGVFDAVNLKKFEE